MFVDDEPCVLEGIERMLFAFDRDWDVRYATSAANALEVMESNPIDALVTDMRMPGMNGADLLERVQSKWPGTLRILLSGQADQDAAFRALRVAHRFLSKPCEGRVLIRAVERFTLLESLLSSPELRDAVGNVDNLPPAPRVYARLWSMLSSSDHGVSHAAALIAVDPAISAKVLHLANSAFLRRGPAIEDIHTAVTRIGVAMLRTLVLATEVFTNRRSDDERVSRLQTCAVLSSVLARRMMVAHADCEVAATAALLADIGLLVPDVDALCASVPTVSGLPVTHAEVGAYLLGLWGLPTAVVEAVAHHHVPARASESEFGPVTAVHVAVALVNEDDIDEDLLRQLGVIDALPGWRLTARALGSEANE
jgi:HD-like signal output (HDOD) protein